jgi:PAS domain S-box-containing protein
MSELPEYPPPPPDPAVAPPGGSAVSPALRDAVFDPESWRASLEAYARSTHLAVALVDAAGRLRGPCHNPRPTWRQFQASQEAAAGGGCPFAVAPRRPCTCVGDALAQRELVLARDRPGLVHVAVPLVLDDQPLGALLAGQVFDQYPEQLLLEHLAKHLGLAPQAVWQVARLEVPVTRPTLRVYGRLLAHLGQAFLHARYHTLLEAQRVAALEQQRDLLAVTLRSIGDAVVTLDPHGRITFLNPVAEALTGWPLAEAQGQAFETVCPLVQEGTRHPVARLVAEGRRAGPVGSIAPQTVLRTRDGREVLITASSATIRSVDETLHGIVVVLRDVSAQRRLEEQLRQAQKMQALGTLAGGIAQDFNNILMIILGSTELAQRALARESPIQTHLQRVGTAVQRGAAIVQHILAFSRQTPVERTLISLTMVLRDILPFLRALLPSTIALEAHLPPDPCLVLADATQIHQIMMNFAANAEYAMRGTGGRLIVRLEPVAVAPAGGAHPLILSPGLAVRLSIRDTGVGMPPDVLARIYEPFFTTKAMGHGTGLGLSVVHGIIADHGGTIRVESTVGQGTTFTIDLPRLGEPRAEEAWPPSALG